MDRGTRITTEAELRAHFASTGNAQEFNEDAWVPVGSGLDGGYEDWLQAGNHGSHHVGKSHIDYYGQPSWHNTETASRNYQKMVCLYTNTGTFTNS